MTEEETPEIDPDDDGEFESIPIKPRRFVPVDLLVLATGLASKLCGALVLSFDDAQMMLAAHANYRKDEIADQEAVRRFQEQLAGLPETANR